MGATVLGFDVTVLMLATVTVAGVLQTVWTGGDSPGPGLEVEP